MTKTMTLMIPVRNRPAAPLEVSLESMAWQSRPFDEVVVCDLGSYEPFRADVRELCEQYREDLKLKYIYTGVPKTDLDIPEKILDKMLSVHLWQMNYNIGIRASKSDIIIMSGNDRVFDDNVAEIMLEFYNYYSERSSTKDTWMSGRVKDLSRIPDLSELEDFDKLMNEARYRGGYGFMGASKKWLHKIQGLDETIRWCADIDLARRAKFDGLPVIWISHGRATNRAGKAGRILHLTTHGKSIRQFGGVDVTNIARRGKWFIHRTDGNRKILRNDKDWGIFTEDKLRRAFEKTKMTPGELAESLRIRREDPRKWLEIYA